MSFRDNWPVDTDGSTYHGKNLLHLVREGCSPFSDRWDVNLLIHEIEDKLGTQVVDIPIISKGSNNYGFHFKLSNRPDVLARLARGDVNMPDYDGFTIDQQVPEVKFEAAAYRLLQSRPDILASRLLYHRLPSEYPSPHVEMPKDITGRRLFVFERADGDTLDWHIPTADQKTHILNQSTVIRAALFNFTPPPEFTTEWFLDRLFEQKLKSLPVPVERTHQFCLSLFTSKIYATIGNIAAAAKQSLLRLIPHILPQEITDKPSLYRLVLDHGDYGIHNMSITRDGYDVTSIYDWETGCIVPAILSDPLMAVEIDLVTDEDAAPSITRVPKEATTDEHENYMKWATQYFKFLFGKAPDYEAVIQAGRDARHLWFTLRDWRGDDPEDYFGALGTWAEKRFKKLTADGRSGPE